jgi:hypothetical protein
MPPPAAAASHACFCSFSHSNAHGESRRLQRKDVLDLGAGRRFAPGSALSLKGCLDWQESSSRFRRVDSDGEAVETRARVLAPQRQFVRDSEIQLVNGNGACERGKRLGFPEEGVPTKMVVAVDVDEGIVRSLQ